MIHFLDASALVKRYVEEEGSETLRSLVRRHRDLAVSRLSAAEAPAALARRVREGDLLPEVAQGHAAQLAIDLRDMRVVEVRPRVIELAADLVWRQPLRAYDAMQLASALRLARETAMALTFVCADPRLGACAKGEGLRVLTLGRRA